MQKIVEIEKASKEELIEMVKVLSQIRFNYEKQFGFRMFANGELKQIRGRYDYSTREEA